MPLTIVCAANPLTRTDEPLLTTLIVSAPFVPLTMTLSACAVTAAADARG